MITELDWTPLWVTFKLAAVSTILLALLSTPIAWFLARRQFKGKSVLEATFALPIVLPPTVLGFYLLLILSPEGMLGKISAAVGGPALVFSFEGLVIGSIIYSFPFVAQPLQNAFRSIQQEHLDAAATLGAGPLDRFLSIVLPNAKRGILTAFALGFAHTVGEFGVVLMLGGSIPGETQTMSIAIYENVEMLNYQQAHWMSAILLVFSFVLLSTIYAFGSPSNLLRK